jgi:hypothetical protein
VQGSPRRLEKDGAPALWRKRHKRDNRSVMHQANPDYDMTERRYLYRLLLKGDIPV